MPLLQFDLPRRLVAGLYACIVRRELSAPTSERLPRSSFMRALTVAFGESFAGGHFVRGEFGLALHQRISKYGNPNIPELPSVEVLDHADAVVTTIAFPDRDWTQINISNEIVAQAVIFDYERLRAIDEGTITDWSSNGQLGSLWPKEEPSWWRAWRFNEPPDIWVDPMSRLGQPIWSSKRLSPQQHRFSSQFWT